LTGLSSFARENQPPRQNWGKFKAHKWGGFTGRLKGLDWMRVRARRMPVPEAVQ